MSQDANITKILEILKVKPMTPTELSLELDMSREHISRHYLYPLVEQKKIVKIEGTSKYQLVGQMITSRQVERILATESEFANCETIKNWRKYNTSKKRDQVIATFEKICLGRRFKDFKINPDSWSHPQDTERLIQVIRAQTKSEKLNHGTRICIRAFLIYGLRVSLTESDSRSIGIEGDKSKAGVSTLHITEEQYNKAKEILKSDEVAFLKFGFSYGTFCRPSTKYTVKVDDLKFYDRITEYVEIDGEIVKDKKIIAYLKQNSDITVTKETKRACRLEVHEHKTSVSYPKFIFDEEIAIRLEEFCKRRKNRGMTYLFWDNNNTVFNFEDYDRIVCQEVIKDNDIFKNVFFKIGFNSGDFGKKDRANYAIRHFGVQRWLKDTNFNYGLVADMGWEDINTLKIWYGKRPASEFEKALDEI